MLDNMDVKTMTEASENYCRKVQTEASGGISREPIGAKSQKQVSLIFGRSTYPFCRKYRFKFKSHKN